MGWSPTQLEARFGARRLAGRWSGTRLKRTARALLVVTVALSSVGFVSGCNASSDERLALDLMNQARSAAGLRQVSWNDGLANKARDWASHMASNGRLSHSSVTQGASPGWHYLAENVGVAGDVPSAQQAFMASASHRKNILDPRFDSAGIGIVYAGGQMWVVQEFRG